ncbi:glycosyltransferase family 9 protein [Hyphobacterium sp. CCMP332]|nr:glycosyltransferase family 9 protein [Hyphobacterium sp. CCMP332]
MKILIVRFSSIGDIVLTTPVIRTLKNQLNAEIHYCTKAQYSDILSANPYLNGIHLLDDKFSTLVKKLKKENFDILIDLHNNIRTKRLKLALGIKSTYTFNKVNFKKWLLVNFKVNKLPNVHIVDRYMDTVKALGVENDNLGLEYFIDEKDEIEKEWLPESHRKKYVAFVIGAKFNTKKLPVERMIELCDKINKPIVLIGGPEDASNAKIIEEFFERKEENASYEEGLKELGKKTEVFNACGRFSINQSADLIRKASHVFTHDTGMMHIAAAFKKNVFSIWGNTIPSFGMYPYQTKFTVLENNKISCRPCSKIGYNKCPKGHFKCMNDIVFDFYIP